MSRRTFAALALGTIAVGLAVHRLCGQSPPALCDIAGDALYATMIAWWAGAAAPRAALWHRAAAAFGLSVGIEVSQLVHEPHADALRATPLGQLVLGSGFDPRDIAAYGAGVIGASLAEHAVRQRAARRSFQSRL